MIWRSKAVRTTETCPRSECGFTLIELLIVLAIAGLALSVFGWRQSPISVDSQAASTAQQIFTALRSARAEAFSSNRSIEFVLDADHHQFAWGSHPVVQLPSKVSVAMLAERAQSAGTDRAGIRFDPDGGSTGGRVAVAGGVRAYLIGVDWISGRVTFVRKDGKP
jgi:general secretion pathway protein H